MLIEVVFKDVLYIIDDEEAICLRILEVTDKCEENIDSKSIISQTSFPDIQEETGEEFITSLFDFNADIKTEIQIERVENEENPYTECSNEIETKTCDQYIITSCDPIPPEASLQPPPALKLKPKEKKYGICPYCGDRYALSSLSLHIRRHTGEKPYKCDMCDKAFVELHDLKRHKRMHTGEKPHVCATCGKAFSQQNKLARHNLVHTGERPYKCEHCDKAFTQRNELNLHIRRHTGFKPYTCGICGECFLTGTFLRNHQKSTSHFEEDKQDRFIKIRVTNPSRSYRNRGCKNSKKPTV